MEGCASPLRAVQDAVQPVRPLGTQRCLGRHIHAVGRGWRPTGGGDAGFHPCESAPLGGRRKRGADVQAIGRSRGGRTTKIHAAVDEHGRPRRLIIRPGHRGDAPVAPDLIDALAPRLCLADGAYDSDAFRRLLLDRGTTPVIPNNPTRKRQHPFDRQAYRLRNVIERTFGRLKDWRRIATRYDKLARNFLAAVAIAAIVIYWL